MHGTAVGIIVVVHALIEFRQVHVRNTWIYTWQAHAWLNEEDVLIVVTTITALGKATQQHCEWLRPRGLEGCILQVPPVVKLRHAKVVVSRQ